MAMNGMPWKTDKTVFTIVLDIQNIDLFVEEFGGSWGHWRRQIDVDEELGLQTALTIVIHHKPWWRSTGWRHSYIRISKKP